MPLALSVTGKRMKFPISFMYSYFGLPPIYIPAQDAIMH